MKNYVKALILVLIVVSSFLAGYWLSPRDGRDKPTAQRKIIHYVDPMHPSYTSDKPGIAPDCGMQLEPVYADESGAGGADPPVSMPPGTVRISSEKQQLIGVKTVTVEKIPWSHTLRVLGRVTPDETRTYRINAAVNGSIEEVRLVTTGSQVKENEVLATFYSLEYRNLVQNYVNLISISREGSPGAKALTQSGKYSGGPVGEGSQIEYYRKNLLSYGLSDRQIEEIDRTRMIPHAVEIRSPIAGFVLFRNVSPGLRFDRGTEFFRIADLSRVWILVDLFETESAYFKPGARVKMELPYQKKTLYGRMSDVLPQFDPASRTLKVRLEADNPGFAMRPDMFVNVELPISGPPAIIVPADAVIDSGLKKTVYVDRGNGYFEPRQVETGRALGERIEISRGLMSGDTIVVSGNFLVDSEARMQLAAAGITGKAGRDVVCGMNIDEDRSRAAGNLKPYQGKTYFFCSSACRDQFVKTPERFVSSPPAPESMPPSRTKAKAAADPASQSVMKKTDHHD